MTSRVHVRILNSTLNRMATPQLVMWAASVGVGLFLMLNTSWAQQGYAFYDLKFVDIYCVCFGNAGCVIDKSVTRSPTQAPCRNHMRHVQEIGGQDVAG